jgi:membrane associated rhomboid family serine protease
MIALVVAFALQCINDVYLRTPVEFWLALTTEGLKHGFFWQLITFQFLHGSLWHLFGNLIGLWFFGRFVEDVVGKKRFLLAYLGAGVAGGMLQGTLMLLFPTHYGIFLYGASAGVSGLFAIFARLESRAEVRWNFILPIRARTLLWIYTAVALFFTLVPSPRDSIAHAAHLGGILAGLAFVRLGWHRDFQPLPWDGAWQRFRQSFRRPEASRFARRPPMRFNAKGSAPRPEGDPDFISKEVDPILDKISAHGIQSLTERERRILEAARARMAKR